MPKRLRTANRLMAVVDQPARAEEARDRLVREGFPASAVAVLAGAADADRIDSLGLDGPRWRRLWRLLQFTQMDQMVDLAVYEVALRHGRAVVAVRARREKDRRHAQRILEEAADAHFMNAFGWFATADISRWRGEELPLPPELRR